MSVNFTQKLLLSHFTFILSSLFVIIRHQSLKQKEMEMDKEIKENMENKINCQ